MGSIISKILRRIKGPSSGSNDSADKDKPNDCLPGESGALQPPEGPSSGSNDSANKDKPNDSPSSSSSGQDEIANKDQPFDLKPEEQS